MPNLISTRVTQFSYFEAVLNHPDWKASRVLDFGGNVGTFLVGAGHNVEHENYWCVDLNEEVIEQGRQSFPRAHFVHYNRYNSQYNPKGIRNLRIPDCGVKFDIILAFSVFTHMDRVEMLELVGSLRSMLAPGGVLAFTFCDQRYDRSLSDPQLHPGSDVRKNLERERVKNSARDIDEKVERACQSNWCVVIDEEVYVEPGDELGHQRRVGQPNESYCSYYTAEFMASLFPDAMVLPPVSPEWQHCCVLRGPQ
ncbi:MAG TPA: class I SAM-dependent methyltransferase [Pyrinomonadaceae bacterium]|nr:class I SAM-dependent methyltransferase [Pyrinomonadaceae bacterium]